MDLEQTDPFDFAGSGNSVNYINPSRTEIAAQASLAAYDDFDGKKVNPPMGFDKNFYSFRGWAGWNGIDSKAEKFGLIFKYTDTSGGNRFLIAFRGTDSDADVLSDFYFLNTGNFTPYRNSVSPAADDLSQGFLDVYTGTGKDLPESMQTQIFKYLEPQNPTTIIITGHSLGAALSQIFTLDMRASLPNTRIVTVNFASPKVGCQDWQAACDNMGATSIITRVINTYDLVPGMPFSLDPLDPYVAIGAEFQTAFYGSYWDILDDEIRRHSMLNLNYVLTRCLLRSPQVWVDSFPDQSSPGSKQTMYSLDPTSFSREEWIAKYQGLRQTQAATADATESTEPPAES